MNWEMIARVLSKSRGGKSLNYPSTFMYSYRSKRKRRVTSDKKVVVFHGNLSTNFSLCGWSGQQIHIGKVISFFRKPKKSTRGIPLSFYQRRWL